MISIVVCTYNRELYLPKMLNSVTKQQCDNNDFELILVNNKSTDNTEFICNEFAAKNTKVNFIYIYSLQLVNR